MKSRDSLPLIGLVVGALVAVLIACGVPSDNPLGPSGGAAFGPSSVPHGPSSAPHGPSSAPHGPSSAPHGPSTKPTGPSSVPGGGGGPTPPTPTPTPTPSPTLPPGADVLEVTGLSTRGSDPYQLVRTEGCCSAAGNGAFWLDHPFGLQSNRGGGPTSPVFFIRTVAADRNLTANPLISFRVNKCADVFVIFGDKYISNPGCSEPYPTWILSEGWECSLSDCAGGVQVFYNVTTGSDDQVAGAQCRRTFGPGQVHLGPREAGSDPDAKTYTVVIQDAFDASGCP
jgi:hypothetical protein